MIRNFNKNFCYGLIILLKGMVKYFKDILDLMKNKESSIKDEII